MDDLCPTGFVADCPARLSIEIMSDKWAVCAIWALSRGPARHGEVITRIGGLSRKVLTQTLRRLQGYGLVEHVGSAYGLTDLGRTLVEPIRILTQWSVAHGAAVTDFQEAAAS